MKDIAKMTLKQLSESIAKRELSSEEITGHFMAEISEKEKETGAFLSVLYEGAAADARECDRQLASGSTFSALFGIPVGIKDNILTENVTTTCASQMLKDFVPPYSATAWEKLRSKGAVLAGKCNMDEFAMGSSTENSSFQVTKNPWNTRCVPGGSSGGSAACVAAGEVPYALGSDTGGSIRQPAAFCGVVGMKPTYGSVSRYGLVAFASSLDQIGPITRNVEDNALVLSAISGKDSRDSTSRALYADAVDFSSEIGRDISGLRIGIPAEMLEKGTAPQVKNAVLNAARTLESLGCRVSEVHLESIKDALPAYYVISSAEASSNLARFDGIRYGRRAKKYDDLDGLYVNSRSEGFGDEVKRRILLGTYVLSAGYYDAYYKKAQQVRTLVRKEFCSIFQKYDVLVGPVAPTTAYGIGEKAGNPMEMYLGDIDTVSVNIAGIPALSMPCGIDTDGLPIGLQLMGNDFSEPLLYRVGYALEKALSVPSLDEYKAGRKMQKGESK